jgi:hypothetical protein
MPPLSTNMHFGKLFIENSKTKIHIPDTIAEDDFEDIHTQDEDGNIDVREFYEQFDFNKLNFIQKSFVLGYYCHLWFDEYYKFNASKLTIHNNLDLTDEELGVAVRSILKHYDNKVINNFFDKYSKDIDDFNEDINLNEIEGICIKKTKEKIREYLKETVPDVLYPQLIDENEYLSFIRKGCSKIMKSL